MSEADVHLLRAWDEGQRNANEPLDFWYEEAWAENIDHRAMEGAPDDVGPINGRDAMRRYLADWYEMFDGFSIVLEDAVDVGPGRVIALWQVSGRAKLSGVSTELSVAIDYTIRGGKIVRGREYQTVEEALETAGSDS
jgi:ketosteroid isomerase-like protein